MRPEELVASLTDEDLRHVRMFECQRLLHSQKVDIVGRVDGQRNAVDVVRHGCATAQFRIVLNVVDE